ncbi:MAG: SDR family oxidoreductase [Betaproteobacteria bacterium]|nr:SDR family oxidoreductase [Betaproteobacteria bacterium]
MNLDLKGKSVLVTGGNRGIGLAIALGFAEEGANVAVCGRDQEALAQAEAKLAAKGVKAKAVSVDLFTAAGCITAVQTAVDAFGGLDVLVNNASTSVSGNIETLDDEGLMERLTGKTLAYMRCCRAALPHLRKAARGRVICIGGSAVRHANATALPSALGNSALVAFVKQFSTTVAAQGITANIVHPPFTKTDRYPARRAALAKRLGVTEAEAEAHFAKNFPIGRIVEPADIAPMVLFLASPHASAITGQSIAIDGGSTPGTFY